MTHASSTGTQPTGRIIRLLQAAVLVAAGWWVFAPAMRGGWLWDDNIYFTHNPLLHDPARLWKIWFAPGSFNEYYPVTTTLQYLEWAFSGGSGTFVYHATNLILHLAGALLVWRLFEKLGLRLAWIGGLLFAVHPLAVESVAWLSEMKNTLFLPAVLLYLDYDETDHPLPYRLSLALFVAATLSKITVAPFPLVILLHAWWKRDRVTRRDLLAAAPYFIIAVALLVLTLLAGSTYTRSHPTALPEALAGGRLAGPASAGLVIFFYLAKFFWPAGLSIVYTPWSRAGTSPLDFLPWLALALILGGLWWKRRENWSRALLFGLGFFLIMLTPVLGFIMRNVAFMVWSLDHLVYLPMIGLAGLTVAGLDAAAARLSPGLRLAGAGLTGALLALLAVQSHAYDRVFRDNETLWRYTLQRNPGSWSAHDALGTVLQVQHRLPEAMAEYETARALNPRSADPDANMANILFNEKRIPEAMTEYARALQISPDDATIRYNLGNALARIGHMAEAAAQYRAALTVNPSLEQAHYNLGNLLAAMGQPMEASQEYIAALQLDPDHANAHTNLGNVLLELGQVNDALREYDESLRINPRDADVRANLGLVLLQLGQVPAAQLQFELALQFDPNNANARAGLTRATALSRGSGAPPR